MRLIRNKPLKTAMILSALVAPLMAAEVVNVYSHRHYEVDQEIHRRFTAETGIEVKVINAEADQLIERLKSEGEGGPADVLVTVDAGRMQRAKDQDLLQAVKSELLDERTPEALRDADGYWYPYTLRARVILVATERVKPGEITRFEDLADPKWRGRLLIRSSSNSYNQSLMASIIAANGEEKAAEWAKGVVRNFARPPQGGDRDQIKAVAAGLADVCVANTYYLGQLLASPDKAERAAAAKVRVVFPNQNDRGTHANVAAAGITKHSKNVEQARAYIEFLLSPAIQKLLANGSFEYPVNLDLKTNPVLASWGEFKPDHETFPKLGENQAAAIRIFDQTGWK
jgi:iron(III) transport system substrate-binding protein